MRMKVGCGITLRKNLCVRCERPQADWREKNPHNSFIGLVDRSEDPSYIHSVCGAHELLFFKVSDDGVEQDQSGASNTKGIKRHTSHAKYGWLVTRIFTAGTEGTHTNDVDFSHCGGLIATGDDYGLVNVWRNPARKGAKLISLRSHSEHVFRTRFTHDDSLIILLAVTTKLLFSCRRNKISCC
ncbi:unnamed protein product [Moneuplotes crassus]|uniref:Uncharacterized protein n=1 Tax=Euplotes crassus TaxID=5936 RepID=A0AAD1Y537_EUPCR|nr:unnamed protein product [Moneuplotes crassus]